MRSYLKEQQLIQLRLADKAPFKELGYALINYIKKKNIVTISTYSKILDIVFILSDNLFLSIQYVIKQMMINDI